jgi:hypothetical protein
VRDRDRARCLRAIAQQGRRAERSGEISAQMQRADRTVDGIRAAELASDRRQDEAVAEPCDPDVDADRDQRNGDGEDARRQ